MRGRLGILIAAFSLGACGLLGSGGSPEASKSKQDEPAPAKAESKVSKAEAEAAIAEAKAAVEEAKAAVEEAKAGAVEPPYPSLDPKLLEAIPAMLDSAAPDPDVRIRMAAAALEDLEARRIPKSLVDALDALGSVSPDQVALVIAKAISGDGGKIQLVRSAGERAWLDVCKDGDEVLSALASAAPPDRPRLMWNACKLEGNGLLDEKEASSSPSFMLPVLALTIHGYIKARTEVHPVERQALRTLATGK
jgi:hypothetical protein